MKEQFLSFSNGGFTLPQEEVVELKSKNKQLSIFLFNHQSEGEME